MEPADIGRALQPDQRRLQPGLVHVGEHHPGAVVQQPPGRRQPQLLPGAGDDGRPALDREAHRVCPLPARRGRAASITLKAGVPPISRQTWKRASSSAS